MKNTEVKRNFKAVVLGASAGGINALGYLFSQLGEDFALPVMVTKHVGSKDSRNMLHALARQSSLPIKIAKDKDQIKPGTIYLAPPGYHMLIEQEDIISLNLEAPVAYSRPSIDVLFQSAAIVYGSELMAVVLTGANCDGAEGIRTVKELGGTTIAQSLQSAKLNLMPKSSFDTGCVDQMMPLEEISVYLDQVGCY